MDGSVEAGGVRSVPTGGDRRTAEVDRDRFDVGIVRVERQVVRHTPVKLVVLRVQRGPSDRP